MERAPQSMDSETTGVAVGWHASALSALKVAE
jgi:hypothetical protein